MPVTASLSANKACPQSPASMPERLRIHFQPPVCHNGLWLLDVFRFGYERRRQNLPLSDLNQEECHDFSAANGSVGR
jgi:hypothetical protein